MRQRPEGHQGKTGFGRQSARQASCHQRGQGVLQVVPAHQSRQVGGIVFDRSARQAHTQDIAFNPAPGDQRAPGRDRYALAANPLGRGFDQRIIEVDHREVRRGLRGKDARLDRHIGIQGGVAIQVVRRNIEQDRHLRPERHDGLKLKTRHLEHTRATRLSRRSAHGLGERHAQIAAHEGGPAIGGENCTTQSRSGRLAVGSRDGDQGRVHKPRRQLQLAGDGGASLARGLHLGQG